MRHFLGFFTLLICLLPKASDAASIYLSPSNGYPTGEHPADWLDKRTSEIKIQKWLRLKLSDGTTGWTSEDTVINEASLVGRALILSTDSIMGGPAYKSEHLGTVETGEFVTLIENQTDFLKVRSQAGTIGFVAKRSCLTADKIKKDEAVFAEANIILRSAPTPGSNEVRRSQKLLRARILETSLVRWGKVEVPGKGAVWWPLEEKLRASANLPWPKFSSDEIFVKRKIFDIAASPTVPNLRIASASGIFRSINDRDWEKIPQFGEQNHPVAISSSGRIFVGFWLSDNHGETFQSYVRFDQLVSSLKNRWKMNPQKFKFIEVKPLSADGRELVLKVDIGRDKPVEALTHDQGITWKAL